MHFLFALILKVAALWFKATCGNSVSIKKKLQCKVLFDEEYCREGVGYEWFGDTKTGTT